MQISCKQKTSGF